MKRLIVLGVLFGCSSSASVKTEKPLVEPQQQYPKTIPLADVSAADAGSIMPTPAALVAWTIPADAPKRERTVEVYARDADAQALMMELSDSYLDVVRPLRASGQVQGPRDSVRAALVSMHPELAKGAYSPSGKGRKVDISYFRANARDVLRLLADVLGANIIVPPGTLPDLRISVRRTPSDGLVEAVADRVGLTVHRHAATFFLLPKGAAIDTKLLSVGRKIDLSARAAKAGEVMAAVDAVTKTKQSIPCDSGRAMESLRLRRAPIGTAVVALSFSGTAQISTAASDKCQVATLSASDDTKGAKLIAIAHAGAKSAAVIRLSGGETRLYTGKGIAFGFARLPDDQVVSLYPPSREATEAAPWWQGDVDTLRLSATLHRTKSDKSTGEAALVERDDQVSWLRNSEAVIERESITLGDKRIGLLSKK